MGVCNCSMFCCTLLYVHSSVANILMGKRGLVVLLNLSSWCLVMVEWLFLAVPWGCLWFVIVVFPDHTQLLFVATESREKIWPVKCIYAAMAQAAVHYKAVVLLLLLIDSLLLLPLFVGVLCLVQSSLAFFLKKIRELVAVLYVLAV